MGGGDGTGEKSPTAALPPKEQRSSLWLLVIYRGSWLYGRTFNRNDVRKHNI